MRKSTVLSLNKFSFFKNLSEHKRTFLLIFLLIFGILTGVLLFLKNPATATYAKALFNSFIERRADESFIKILLNSSTSFLLSCLLLFVLGSSMMGVVLLPFLVTTFGLYYGLLSSYICAEYSLKGIAFNSVILIPVILLFFGVTVMSAGNSLDFSLQIAKLTLYKNSTFNLYFSFKAYCVKFSIACILYVFVALVDAILSSCFLDFFTFK